MRTMYKSMAVFVAAILGMAFLAHAQVSYPFNIISSAICSATAGSICMNSGQGSIQVTVNGITGQTVPTVPIAAATAVPANDLICEGGSDPTINVQTITGATLVNGSVFTVGSALGYVNGSKITVTGVNQAGWNTTAATVTANPTSTTITTSINALALSAISGGTPKVSLTCNNSSDATSNTAFATSYTIPANTFLVAGKTLKMLMTFAEWTPANITSVNPTLTLQMGGGTAYQGQTNVTLKASHSYYGFSGAFYLTSLQAAGAATEIAVANEGPFIPAVVGAGSNTIGFLMANAVGPVLTGSAYSTNGNLTPTIDVRWTLAAGGGGGIGGTIAYASGGTATGTGNCLGTASNGTGTGAAVLWAVSGGVISGNATFGPTVAQTNAGNGYGTTTNFPTTWALSVPTTGGASTCSSTVTSTGGTQAGGWGSAYQLVTLIPEWLL